MPGGRPVFPPSVPGVRNSIITDGGEAPSEPDYADPQELMAQVMTQSCPMVQPAGIYMIPHVVPSASVVQQIDQPVPIYTGVQTINSIPVPDVTDIQPPPPPPLEPGGVQQHAIEEELDLPPPPPPEELAIYATVAEVMLSAANGPVASNGNDSDQDKYDSILREKSQPGPRKKVGSVVETHASIIANLNAQFANKPGPAGKPPPSPSNVVGGQAPPLPQPGSQDYMSHSQSSESDTTPTAEEPSGQSYGFLGQIQRGMSLKRTVTNDRSAPKLK